MKNTKPLPVLGRAPSPAGVGTKTVVGYSPYQQAGMPKGPLLIVLIGVVVGVLVLIGVMAAIGSSSSEPSVATGHSTSAAQAADIAQMDYSTGYDAGLVNLQLYPAGISMSQMKAQCKLSWVRDNTALRATDSSMQISQPDYLRGCYDAAGVS